LLALFRHEKELAVATRTTIVWPIQYEHHWVKRGISRGGELLQFMYSDRLSEIVVDFFLLQDDLIAK
jgi:hypothetical protein